MKAAEDLQRVQDAYKRAWEEAKRYGDEAIEAFEMADIVSSGSARKVFLDKAKRALVASENYRKAADLCAKVIDEIHS